MTTSTTIRDAQIKIAYEVLMMDETGKTKKEIANEYGVSPRSVTRYAEKYEIEALDLLSEQNIPEENLQLEAEFSKDESVKYSRNRRPLIRDSDGLTHNQRGLMAMYIKQKNSGEMNKSEDRRAKVGRAKKGIKTIRYITMEILEEHAKNQTLTRKNKESIIQEIMTSASVDEKVARQYFSGHKNVWGGFQD